MPTISFWMFNLGVTTIVKALSLLWSFRFPLSLVKVWAPVIIKHCAGHLDRDTELLIWAEGYWKCRALSALQGWEEQAAALSSCLPRVLQHLEQSHWLDHRTKSLFVEFVVFNANVNLFCVVTLMLESNNVGTKASSSPPSDLGISEVPVSYITKRHYFN